MNPRSDLRELFIAAWSEEYSTLLGDLELDKAAINYAHGLRGVWDQIVVLAEKNRKLQRMVELAKKKGPLFEDKLDQAWKAYVAQSGFLPSSGSKGDPWPNTLHRRVNRAKQIRTFEEQVRRIENRPFALLWCGDVDARHDILRDRINLSPWRLGKQTYTPTYKRCMRDGDALNNLVKICEELTAGKFKDETGEDRFAPLRLGMISPIN